MQKKRDAPILTDHALVDPGSASPRMRCIGGRASSGNSRQSVNYGLGVTTPISLVLTSYLILSSALKRRHPSIGFYSIGSILTGHGSGPGCHSPKKTRNAHLLVPRGRAGCLHHLALPPPVPKTGTRLKPPLNNGPIHQSLIQGPKILSSLEQGMVGNSALLSTGFT